MELQKNEILTKPDGPVVLVIVDGVGVAPDDQSNAVTQAATPVIDQICSGPAYRTLLAHGTHVGLPSDSDIGNSEVGHNAMGAGRIFDQGAKLINQAIEDGSMYESKLWNQAVGQAKAGGTLHLLGLLSDGRVHSDIAHLHSMIGAAIEADVRKLRVHILLDGRDTPQRSALGYIERTEKLLKAVTDGSAEAGFEIDYKIASGGGRMKITMDRYDADWDMVKRGYDCHTHGVGRQFGSATEAVETMYQESELGDQDLDSFVIVNQSGEPVGKMSDGDVVILFNFRGERAIEISRAYEEADFSVFDRGVNPDVTFIGMLQYDGDLFIPKNYLVEPPQIQNTVSEYFAAAGLRSFAVSETQKFGHVTYFWNGNRSGFIDETLETFVEVPSDNVSFDTAPAMKAAEITDEVIQLIETNEFAFGRLNYPNGDMVGHTGNLDATKLGMETIDAQLGRLAAALKDAGGLLVYVADHGNADVMYTDKGGVRSPVTSHTVNPVPFAIYDPAAQLSFDLSSDPNAGLGNLAATLCELLGFDAPPDYLPSLIIR